MAAVLGVGVKAWRRVLRRCVALGVAACLAKLVVLHLMVRRMKRALAAVPFARYKASAVTGFLQDFIRNRFRMNQWREETSRGLPLCKMVGLPLDPTGIKLVCRDPLLLKHVLKDNFDNYTKPEGERDHVWYYLGKWLGSGLFTVRHGSGSEDGGHSWSRQRKISSAIFSRRNFNDGMQAVFAAKAAELRRVLEKPADLGEKVDMQQLFFCFTMDSIMEIFFSEPTDTMRGGYSSYASAYDTAHRKLIEVVVGLALPLRLVSLLPWPVGGSGGLLWKLLESASRPCREFHTACRTLDSESRRLIRACRADPGLSDRTDLLALFVKCEDQEGFSSAFLKDVVLNFIIAGRDTTACLLTWMFFILATHPEIQRELCEEVASRCPRECAPTFKQLGASEMPYLNGVLYETLRLYPPVPSDLKVATRDDVLPDGTRVPAGCDVIFLPFAMGRDGSRYAEPLKVDPHRWIPFSEPAPHEFPVFQAGPRICLGKDMAIFEAKLVACAVLQQYTFEMAEGEAEKITCNNTLTMSLCNSKTLDSHNLWLIPKRRSS
mmetsp:Transcript_96627/g.288507  ORF Transcript_96627/g.288507 Transcript_96627/m.288507 type:complete len:548 (-) Transcript_96627:171-1814(-)